MNKLSQIRHRISGNLLHRNVISLNLPKPVVTFTFDDFPKSAANDGAAILEQHEAKGTFYASMHLMATSNHLGEMFDLSDIENLRKAGHEIGSHTYSHKQPYSQSTEAFDNDLQANLASFNNSFPDDQLLNFSFPFGQANGALKSVAKNHFRTSRGIYLGYHSSSVDLNLLKANKLYSDRKSSETIPKLLHKTAQSNGWVIFYTHDVRNNCSAFGCSPDLLRNTVSQAVDLGFEVLSVDQVCQSYLSQ